MSFPGRVHHGSSGRWYGYIVHGLGEVVNEFVTRRREKLALADLSTLEDENASTRENVWTDRIGALDFICPLWVHERVAHYSLRDRGSMSL